MANVITNLFTGGARLINGTQLNTMISQINAVFAGTTAVSGVKTTGTVTAKSATAATAGGVAAIAVGSGGVVLAWGSGVPTLSAAQGSLYLRTDGSSTSTRLYVNTDGATTWTDLTSGA